MMDKNIARFVFILIAFIVVLCIFLNPLTNLAVLRSNPYILANINSFLSRIGFSYRFVFKDICAIMRFTEYFVFGIIAMVLTKSYSKNIFKSITVPLFIGLFIAVGEIYYRFLSGFHIGINEVIVSFVEFCIGMIFYIIFTGTKPAKDSGFKYKSRKYDGRR